MPHETPFADRWIHQLLLIRNEMLLQRLKKHYTLTSEKYDELMAKLVNIQYVTQVTSKQNESDDVL